MISLKHGIFKTKTKAETKTNHHEKYYELTNTESGLVVARGRV